MIPLLQFVINCQPIGQVPLELRQQTEKSIGHSTPNTVFTLPFDSKLSFNGVTWPEDLSLNERVVLALALNITGSFEGPNGWSNLSDNFDDQGFSLGLLNQNLGTGSLQPLLISFRDLSPSHFENYFSPGHAKAITRMLDEWSRLKPLRFNIEEFEPQEKEGPLSPLDEGWPDPLIARSLSVFEANASSVSWAEENLYQNGRFKPAWRSELTRLAQDPKYIALQLEAATRLHRETMAYLQRLKFKSLKAYLLLFDFVVQNGGLPKSLLKSFEQWRHEASQNQVPSEITQLKQLTEMRVQLAKKRFQNDVRKRKNAIIDGEGVVHGKQRNFALEFDVSLDQTLF